MTSIIMMSISFAVCILFLVESTLSDNLDLNHNVFCKPVSSVVPVNQDGLPYFVTLHRCQGSVPGHNPVNKECVANMSNTVKVHITGYASKFVKMENHTECTGKCIYTDKCPENLFNRHEENCSCTCKYNEDHPKSCPDNMRWDSDKCKCVCTLDIANAPRRHGYYINEEQCKFLCKPRTCKVGYFLNPNDNCYCTRGPQAVKRENAKSDNGALLPALLAGEFVVLYLIFDFLLYSKDTGLMYNLKKKCSKAKHQESERRQTTQEPAADSTPLTVCVDQNGTSKLHVSSI